MLKVSSFEQCGGYNVLDPEELDMSKSDSPTQRVREGDSTELANAFDRHRARLRRTIEFRLPDKLRGRVDPDDVLQDAYLAATKRHAHVRGDDETSLFVWLRLVVLQTLTDTRRQNLGAQKRDAGREVNGHARADHETSVSLIAGLVGVMTSPSLAFARVETADQLRQALNEMEPLDHEVLALRHFEELANHEVAASLGIEQKAASIRYIRALRKLKTILTNLNLGKATETLSLMALERGNAPS